MEGFALLWLGLGRGGELGVGCEMVVGGWMERKEEGKKEE